MTGRTQHKPKFKAWVAPDAMKRNTAYSGDTANFA